MCIKMETERLDDHGTSVADYGSCARVDVGSSAGDEECELLIKNVVGERRPISGRAVATVIILTAINLLNFMDQATIAGSSTNYRSPSMRATAQIHVYAAWIGLSDRGESRSVMLAG